MNEPQPPERLTNALRDLKREDFKPDVARNLRLDLRISRNERDEISQMAKELNLTVTSYLLCLHRIAYAKLKEEPAP